MYARYDVRIADVSLSRSVKHAAQREGIPPECIWSHYSEESKSPRERIAAHYRFGLIKLFEQRLHSFTIILEDDLQLAKDFISFTTAFLPLLRDSHRSDGTSKIACISGWNDNGASPLLCNPQRVSRTTFFPGLGWTISRQFWDQELKNTWPANSLRDNTSIVGIGWDFWLRAEFDRRGWSCITPEVPRVFHFGSDGVNVAASEKAEYFDTTRLALAENKHIHWAAIANETSDGIASISAKDNLRKNLREANVIHRLDDEHVRDLTCQDQMHEDITPQHQKSKHFLLLYRRENYKSIASRLRLWPTPRGHFHHVLTMHLTRQRTLYIADVRRSMLLPDNVREMLPKSMSLSPANMGVSCAQHCHSVGICSSSGLEVANDCAALKSVFPCSSCVYETGCDLPAFAVPNAGGNLSTEGLCLVAESGTGKDGSFDCTGSFPWTERLCACESTQTLMGRDEL